MELTAQQIRDAVAGKLSRYYGAEVGNAVPAQVYKAVSLCVRDLLMAKKQIFNAAARKQGAKRVYYLCMEFLIGRNLRNNLSNLGLEKLFKKALAADGFDLAELYEIEADPGLGNGGLGRLAACFMDALAAQNYPAMGFTLRYEYGLFKQKIVDGRQIELPDEWLDSGEAWTVPRNDRAFTVRFGGEVREVWEEGRLKIRYENCTALEAFPYDLMLSGEGGDAVSVLRLWGVRAAAQGFDMAYFSHGDYAAALLRETEAQLLTKVLYPSDEHEVGKTLRISQQYALVSASLQNILKEHMLYYGSIETLPDKTAIHVNDTHPALAAPELMRLLLDEHGFSWEKAWDFTTRILHYTNHTVMAEALEQWGEELIKSRLPRVHMILREINNRFLKEEWERFPGDLARQERMSIFGGGQVRMANLAVIAARRVNGVSALHSDIIKQSVFRDFYEMSPDKFLNVTNGIAHRRWLCQANPRLDKLIAGLIGDGYRRDAGELKKLAAFKGDKSVLASLADIKLRNKTDFADFVKREQNFTLNPEARFDTQIKRLHEYKRQLLNVLKIISLYLDLRDDPDADVTPQAFIFGAKAAASYAHAKRVIALINALSAQIGQNKKIKGKLDVLFLENYNVSRAERLIPASEVSQQISLAGKEASGTSNMKFMLNGALTIGTLDGANVEMREAVGEGDIFIFGLTARGVEDLWRQGYYASAYYTGNARIRRIVDALKTGFAGESFADIANYLVANQIFSDPYMCLADFGAYMAAHEKLDALYKKPGAWNKKALLNIAESGRFAADRSIREYAEKVWDLKPVKI
ncbi:MAG: glycogen/starch/alpha-glucan family phosphorylase [Clostridiales bacterium]|jgi:starch phosphorylase|nr:glycogen/starch/alpha-glucan family phosphorylase [Clostridiales bacterium]